ncbi:MAG: LLM class flavin-dependent oxidoreductase [Hymenobacter sp.]|nr:MAG: LLM class flavin-dependent oxidoreductase [Hymenobacter sp.]
MGGTPASVAWAGQLGLPLTITILGGAPAQYVALMDLYRKSAQQAGHAVDQLQLAIDCHFHVADTARQVADEFFPSYSQLMNRIRRKRGWQPMSRAQFRLPVRAQRTAVGGQPLQY